MAEAHKIEFTPEWKIKFQLPNATYQGLPRVTAAKYSSGLATSKNHFAYNASEQEIALINSKVEAGSKEVMRDGRAGGYGAKAYQVNEKKIVHVKTGKSSTFTDFCFDNFDPKMLYTAHSNGVVKGWDVPKKAKENISEAKFSVGEVGPAVNSLSLSEAVSDLLVVNSQDLLTCVAPSQSKVVAHWNLEDGKKDQIYASAFSANSSVIRACCSNRTVYTIDIRNSKATNSLSVGYTPRHIFTMDSSDQFLAVGADSFGRIQYEVWDPRNLDEKLCKGRFDKLTGDTIVCFDPDTKLLFISSRLSTNYMMYDMGPTLRGNKASILMEETLARPCYGLSLTSKDLIGDREAARCSALLEDSLLPVMATMDTKVFKNKQALTPALSSQEWLDGKNGARVQTCEYLQAKVAGVKRLKAKSKIQNVLVEEPREGRQKDYWNQVPVNRKGMTGNHNIRMNEKYMICLVESGQVGVIPIADIGDRFDRSLTSIHGAKNATSFDISQHQQNLVATGDNDGAVRLYEIPDKRGATLRDCQATIESLRVTLVRFHPNVAGILIVTDYEKNYDESNSRVRIFDVTDLSNPKLLQETETPDGFRICDCDVDPSGSRLVIGTRGENGGSVYIYNMQSGKFEATIQPKETHRDIIVRWLSDSEIVTAGHRKNQRSISVYELENPDESRFSEKVDQASGAVLIHVDPYHRLIYFGGIGQTRVRTYEVRDADMYAHGQSHLCNSDSYGMVFIPKARLDVREVELNRFYKLGKKDVVPVSFRLMRKRKEFFQDDVYMKVRPVTSKTTAAQWANGGKVDDDLISLQPKDMVPLSLAPSEAETPGEKMARRRRSDANMQKMTSLSSSVMSSEDSAKKLIDSVKVVENASEWAPGIGQWIVEAEDGGVDEDEWSD